MRDKGRVPGQETAGCGGWSCHTSGRCQGGLCMRVARAPRSAEPAGPHAIFSKVPYGLYEWRIYCKGNYNICYFTNFRFT